MSQKSEAMREDKELKERRQVMAAVKKSRVRTRGSFTEDQISVIKWSPLFQLCTNHRFPRHQPLDPPTILSPTTIHTQTIKSITMFRRVASTVPAQASRAMAAAVRPSIAPSFRAAAPALNNARRSYHEKDMSTHLLSPSLCRWSSLGHRYIGSLGPDRTRKLS